MSPYWMISNRNLTGRGLGAERAPLTYWVSGGGDPEEWTSWEQLPGEAFRARLAQAAGALRLVEDPERNADQQHVTLLVHGYNSSWHAAARRYRGLCERLYAGPASLGLCVLFSWPSDGMPTHYLPDREEARASAPDLAAVLGFLYDWLLVQQARAAQDGRDACRAKTSVLAHSMGCYVLQQAMQLTWTRKNQPLLVSLVNQLLLVAADVDNDLFASGEAVGRGEGEGMANLCYRVTALYSGLDGVLGLSSGLKHFGKRRLGRSGLDRTLTLPDNVWDVDCSSLLGGSGHGAHTAYFEEERVVDLMREILRGTDRKVLMRREAYRGMGG